MIGESLQQLAVLSLQANSLHGSIPTNICYPRNIRVLDLSGNNLSKDIPTCLHNLTTIAQKRNGSYARHYYLTNFSSSPSWYDFHISLMWKSAERVFKNPVVLLRSIDLSSNNLKGKIPLEFGYLVGLIFLNLSRNSLSGQIPYEIGNLKSLEVLDLSRNHFSGKIPSSFAQIYTLSVLDLSKNRLYGEIPVGRQLQTFEASSFDGNINLCGKPLDKMCPEDEAPTIPSPAIEEDNGTSDFTKVFFMSMGLGFPFGFWGLLVPILIRRSWRYAYLKLLNKLTDNIYINC
ncbi:hypothetical protein L6164_012179 [Bauhinia variegata]|uniref:Uncharacterized protein n=1 Tax=Bauhinia variegata TaxID=167791 RepID=A0ACB9PAS7_BAUVA|nr:hypothetical protein L6164_012179 [Bauhinia variegata]